MALTADEQKLFDFAMASLPGWFRDSDEFFNGSAKLFGSVKAIFDYLIAQTLIGGAVGATATTPDWLAQHAKDRATNRQDGEDDPTLRQRIRNTPDALTRASIIAAANAILAAGGGGAASVHHYAPDGAVYMVELPRDAAHFGTYTSMTGVGGEFTAPNGDGIAGFAPSAGWQTPPVDSNHAGYPWRAWTLTTTGSANPANNVSDVTIDGTPGIDLVGNSAQFSNVAAVAAVDAGVTWTAKKLGSGGFVADGFARAYIGRGYRMTRTRPLTIVLIIPYGASAGTEAAIAEMLRQKKAAGIVARIERRTSPP